MLFRRIHYSRFCVIVQNLVKIRHSSAKLMTKTDFFPIWRQSARKFRILVTRFLLFLFALAYKILLKSDDISLKCGDITHFKMAIVRHLAFPNFEDYHIRPLLVSDFAFLYKIGKSRKNDVFHMASPALLNLKI